MRITFGYFYFIFCFVFILFIFSPLLAIIFLFFFFFSSRRRHTRSDRDWSSDVCSSDLNATFGGVTLRIGLALSDATKSRVAATQRRLVSLYTVYDDRWG